MSAVPPVVFHRTQQTSSGRQKHRDRDEHHHHHPHMAKLPVIPDLRFEYSYLRSVQKFIEVERLGGSESAQVRGKRTTAEVLDKALLDEGYETLDASLGFAGKENEDGFAEGSVEVGSGSGSLNGSSEVIKVQWKKVLWVTLRDQVLSPLVQGALWGVAGYYIVPFSSKVRSKVKSFGHPSSLQDGKVVVWLRDWWRNLSITSSTSFTTTVRTR